MTWVLVGLVVTLALGTVVGLRLRAAKAATAGLELAAVPELEGFRPGQVWAFSGCPDAPGARLTVVRLEAAEGPCGGVAHVHLSGLRLKTARSPSGFVTTVAHLPFTIEALRDSVTTREGEVDAGALDGFDDGYRAWLQRGGGVFGIPVGEAVASMAAALGE